MAFATKCNAHWRDLRCTHYWDRMCLSDTEAPHNEQAESSPFQFQVFRQRSYKAEMLRFIHLPDMMLTKPFLFKALAVDPSPWPSLGTSLCLLLCANFFSASCLFCTPVALCLRAALVRSPRATLDLANYISEAKSRTLKMFWWCPLLKGVLQVLIWGIWIRPPHL